MQYQKEERSLIATRLKSSATSEAIKDLIEVMVSDRISTTENEKSLKEDLARLYQDNDFLECKNMGEIVKLSLDMVLSKPIRKKYSFIKSI